MPGGQIQASDRGSLVRLRNDFPGYRIWREVTGSRVRYIARRLQPGPGLHTLVTTDLDEMRGILPTHPTSTPPPAR
jgi:hypothetical protein